MHFCKKRRKHKGAIPTLPAPWFSWEELQVSHLCSMYILLRRRRKESDIRVLAQRASYQKLPDWFIFAVCTIAHSSKKEKRVICEWEGGQHRGSPESHESVEGCLLHLQMNLPASWLYSIWNILGVFLFSCTIVKMLNSTILKKIEGVVKQIVDATIWLLLCSHTLIYF